MKYVVRSIQDNKTVTEIFDSLDQALSVFKSCCNKGICAAIYNMIG